MSDSRAVRTSVLLLIDCEEDRTSGQCWSACCARDNPARAGVEDHTLWVDQEGTPPLTAYEEQVLKLLAKAHTGKEIAATLGVSMDVVRVHVQSLLGKLQVRIRPPDAPPSPPEDAV